MVVGNLEYRLRDGHLKALIRAGVIRGPAEVHEWIRQLMNETIEAVVEHGRRGLTTDRLIRQGDLEVGRASANPRQRE